LHVHDSAPPLDERSLSAQPTSFAAPPLFPALRSAIASHCARRTFARLPSLAFSFLRALSSSLSFFFLFFMNFAPGPLSAFAASSSSSASSAGPR
jgi:hypothetical protein